MSARAIAIVNKWYECDPFLAVLFNSNARPASLGLRWRDPLGHPRRRTNTSSSAGTAFLQPRAVFDLPHGLLEVWCISDLLEDLPDVSAYQSNSRAKADKLPFVLRQSPAQLVIAIGTAALAVGPDPAHAPAAGGHVLVGSTVFMHDFHPEARGQVGHWGAGPFDTVLPSAFPTKEFEALVAPLLRPDSEAVKRLVLPPLAPAASPRIIADAQLASVGSLNVTDPKEYADADTAALAAHAASGGQVEEPRSVETTHGLIRVQSDAPFLFVSGIANRALAAGSELLPRKYAQDTVAASNAGVAFAWMLPQIDAFLAKA
jgi:hypothetical protein